MAPPALNLFLSSLPSLFFFCCLLLRQPHLAVHFYSVVHLVYTCIVYGISVSTSQHPTHSHKGSHRIAKIGDRLRRPWRPAHATWVAEQPNLPPPSMPRNGRRSGAASTRSADTGKRVVSDFSRFARKSASSQHRQRAARVPTHIAAGIRRFVLIEERTLASSEPVCDNRRPQRSARRTAKSCTAAI